MNTIAMPDLAQAFWAHRLDSEQQARVRGLVSYVEPGLEKPYNFMYEPPPGVARENCTYTFQSVEVTDARPFRKTLSIDRQGFELREAPTSVKNFHDDKEVAEVYYDEVCELALEATGGSKAIVFDHVVRMREAGRPPLTFGRAGDGSKPAAVGRVHNDYSETSGRKRLELILGTDAPKFGKRFAIVNIWRSIAGTILDTPLAVCDARTVAASDLVAAEIRYQSRIGEICLATYSPHHRWHFFSDMMKNEAIVFKQFDSVTDVARFTLHSAFDLPNIPLDAPLRQSIEARCLVIFD